MYHFSILLGKHGSSSFSSFSSLLETLQTVISPLITSYLISPMEETLVLLDFNHVKFVRTKERNACQIGFWPSLYRFKLVPLDFFLMNASFVYKKKRLQDFTSID